MGANLDDLERLVALHRSGVLTDGEFAAQKARVLGASSDPVFAAPMMSGSAAAATPQELSKLWQRRFAFFAEYGSPLAVTGSTALRKLPFWTGASIRSNIWGFAFGPAYFMFLGMWKRGVVLAILVFTTSVLTQRSLGQSLSTAISVGFAVFSSMSVNYARYIKVTQGRDEWNPLADLFSGQRHQAHGELR